MSGITGWQQMSQPRKSVLGNWSRQRWREGNLELPRGLDCKTHARPKCPQLPLTGSLNSSRVEWPPPGHTQPFLEDKAGPEPLWARLGVGGALLASGCSPCGGLTETRAPRTMNGSRAHIRERAPPGYPKVSWRIPECGSRGTQLD